MRVEHGWDGLARSEHGCDGLARTQFDLDGLPFGRLSPNACSLTLQKKELELKFFRGCKIPSANPKGPKIEKIQSRLKISISLEIFNPD